MERNIKSKSSFDTLIINREEKPKKRHRRRVTNHKPQGRRYTAEKISSQHTSIRTDRHITQKIHVEKQEFKCIINLNTTVCEHKSRHRQRCDEKQRTRHLDSGCDRNQTYADSGRKVNQEDKIVPICFRQVCHNHSPCGAKLHTRLIKRSPVKKPHNERNMASYRIDDDEKYDHRSKSRHARHKCRHSRHKHKQNVSKEPILPPPLQDDVVDTLSYEDISTTSLEPFVERPTSYKHMKRKHRNKHKDSSLKIHESKLDTLIRRTKERERKLVEQSRGHKPWFSSTPINEFSSGDFHMSNSDMDNSFNSRSTFVIDTRSHFAYSPLCAIQDLDAETACSKAEFNSGAYSPSSPIRNEYYAFRDFEVPRNNDYKLNIKNEPMGIEAYSPIRSPDGFTPKSCDFSAQRVKEEVKIELCSPKLSPVDFENNSGLQFCMIKGVKREVADDCFVKL